MNVTVSFDPGALTLDHVLRITRETWADLPFDRDALAVLKRDGLSLDGVKLGGTSPYRYDPAPDGTLLVTAGEGEAGAVLLDLWRLHFARALRSQGLAA